MFICCGMMRDFEDICVELSGRCLKSLPAGSLDIARQQQDDRAGFNPEHQGCVIDCPVRGHRPIRTQDGNQDIAASPGVALFQGGRLLLVEPVEVVGKTFFIGFGDAVVVDHGYLQIGWEGQGTAEMVRMRMGDDQAIEAGDVLFGQVCPNAPTTAGWPSVNQDGTFSRLMDQKGISLTHIEKGDEYRPAQFRRPSREDEDKQEDDRQKAVWQSPGPE